MDPIFVGSRWRAVYLWKQPGRLREREREIYLGFKTDSCSTRNGVHDVRANAEKLG
jgi:hypothetical protein